MPTSSTRAAFSPCGARTSTTCPVFPVNLADALTARFNAPPDALSASMADGVNAPSPWTPTIRAPAEFSDRAAKESCIGDTSG